MTDEPQGFRLGATWAFTLRIKRQDGQPLEQTAVDRVEWRVGRERLGRVLRAAMVVSSTGATAELGGITYHSPGVWRVVVPPERQSGLQDGPYESQVWVRMSDGQWFNPIERPVMLGPAIV